MQFIEEEVREYNSGVTWKMRKKQINDGRSPIVFNRVGRGMEIIVVNLTPVKIGWRPLSSTATEPQEKEISFI